MNVFTFIKERVSILTVVSEYVTLKRAGGYYKGTCPFHHEKTASFTVSPDKAIFYCFGCHLSGDVIAFIAKIENCSQKEAAQLIAERYQIDLPHTITFEASDKTNEAKNHYFSVCKAVAVWCHEQLLKNQTALSYFYERGFDHKTISYFMLGYFPGGNTGINNLLYTMKKESILAQDLIDATILGQGKTTLFSPFEERLIFPIQDTLSRYCGFGGRIFKQHDSRPKYYNSRENDYFIKGSILFNLDRAKKSIQETGSIFLVEGYTDCMAMVQHNYPNTVATLGTACTIEHLKQLARYADNVFIMYDNDNAGKQAILRLIQLCWQVNLELKVVTLPAQHDPASFLTNNSNLSTLIHSAQDIFFFFTQSLSDKFITRPLHQKLHIAKEFLTIIAQITDPLKKDLLLQRAANAFDIPFTSLKAELEHINSKQPPIENITPTSAIGEALDAYTLEKRIFCAIMNNVQLLYGENRQQLIAYLPSPLKEIITLLKENYEKNNSFTFNELFDILDEQKRQYLSTLLLKNNESITANEFDALLIQLQKKQWKIIVHDIKAQLTRAKQEGNTEKISLILHDFMQLQNIMVRVKAGDN